MTDSSPLAGAVTHVNVVAELLPVGTRFGGPSAIDKRPVSGRIAVGELGLAGDRQVNRKHHGGPDKRVLTPGPVASGDALVVEPRPDHGVRVDELFAAEDVTAIRERLGVGHPEGAGLADPVRAKLGWT